MRSAMRATQPTQKGIKAAARKERTAAAPLYPTALADSEAEAEARAGAVEADSWRSCWQCSSWRRRG